MAVAKDTSSLPAASGRWNKKESLGSALVQIAIVALVLAGIVYFVYQRGATQKDASEGLREARALALRDNPKDLNAAIAKLDALLTASPKLADAHAVAADLHAEMWLVHNTPGADAKAREHLARAEEGDSHVDERYSAKALILTGEGKAAEAEAYVEGLRQKGASTARLWHAQAVALRDQGKWGLARQAYSQAVEKAWKDPRFSAAYGEAMWAEGQYPQAIEMLGKGLAQNPEHFRSLLAVTAVQAMKKDNVKVAAATVAALLARDEELTPGLRARALAVKAELANAEQKPDQAISHADEALKINANDEMALFARARALAQKKDAKAAEAFKAAIAQDKTAPVLYLEGAAMLQTAGDSPGALAILDAYEATFKDVKNPGAEGKETPALDRDDKYWLARGDVLRAQNKIDEAMASYDKAVAAGNVNVFRAHLAKANVYMQQNQLDKAQEALTLIAPTDGSGNLPDAYVAMGNLLFQKKSYADGCQNFAFALTGFKKRAAPRETLVALQEDVNKRLISNGQKPMAKMWLDETKMLTQ